MAAIGEATPGSFPGVVSAQNVHFGGSAYLQPVGGRSFDRAEHPLNSAGDDAANSTSDDIVVGCGKGRVRKSQTHQCRGPADNASAYSTIRH
jgi:hypothetical protein